MLSLTTRPLRTFRLALSILGSLACLYLARPHLTKHTGYVLLGIRNRVRIVELLQGDLLPHLIQVLALLRQSMLSSSTSLASLYLLAKLRLSH